MKATLFIIVGILFTLRVSYSSDGNQLYEDCYDVDPGQISDLKNCRRCKDNYFVYQAKCIQCPKIQVLKDACEKLVTQTENKTSYLKKQSIEQEGCKKKDPKGNCQECYEQYVFDQVRKVCIYYQHKQNCPLRQVCFNCYRKLQYKCSQTQEELSIFNIDGFAKLKSAEFEKANKKMKGHQKLNFPQSGASIQDNN